MTYFRYFTWCCGDVFSWVAVELGTQASWNPRRHVGGWSAVGTDWQADDRWQCTSATLVCRNARLSHVQQDGVAPSLCCLPQHAATLRPNHYKHGTCSQTESGLRHRLSVCTQSRLALYEVLLHSPITISNRFQPNVTTLRLDFWIRPPMEWAARLSSVDLSVTLLHHRQRLELFGNIFAPPNSAGTRTVCVKILRKNSKGF